MIYGIVLGLHVLVCIILVLLVLLQSSKGTGLASGAFGGGAESTVFGGRGAATVLSKATTIFGAAFMVTSLSLTLLGSTHGTAAPRSIVAEEAAKQAPLGAGSETAPPGGEPGAAPGGAPGAQPAPTLPAPGQPVPPVGQGAQTTPSPGTQAPPPPPAGSGGTQGQSK
jgi:preprotein translocase subunit SecG